VVPSRNDRSENHGVNKGASCFCAGHLKHEGEWRGGGFLGREAGGVVGDVEADKEDREDVEEEDAPEYILYYAGEVFGGVLCFAGCDGYGFCAAV
jgi:hypothetical protein